jgi:hypothetical protein
LIPQNLIIKQSKVINRQKHTSIIPVETLKIEQTLWTSSLALKNKPAGAG